MRTWLGASLVTGVVFVVTVPYIQQKAPVWFWVFAAVVILVAILLTLPVRTRAEAKPAAVQAGPESAFIRGNVRNATVARVDSDADVFIDGDVEYSRIFDIIFKRRRRN
jgi:hypothetical protein